MSISSLVQELWQFLFIRDWLEIRKSEIPKFAKFSELLTENQQEGRGVVKLPPTQISVKYNHVYSNARVSTQVNKNQHESTRINMSLARINMSPTQVNTNQHESNTIQHESDTSQHE